MGQGRGLQNEPNFGGRHALILAGIFSVLFGISIATSLILGAESVEELIDDAVIASSGKIEEPTVVPGPESTEEPVADLMTEHGRAREIGPAESVVAPDGGPLLAVVIDDWGYGWAAADDFLALPVPINVAVIPYLPYSRRHAEQAVANGHQVILHLPMEPLDTGWDLGEGAVTTAMTDDAIVRDVEEAWFSVPYVSGVNNHMGSKATADERVVTAVLTVVKEQSAFFLDSRTTSQSVIGDVAEKLGVRYVVNDRFIDPDPDADRVRQRVLDAARIAKNRGWAVVIGHVQPATYTGLTAALPFLESEGIRLASLDEILARIERESASLDDEPPFEVE